MQNRKVTYALYPTPRQIQALLALLGAHKDLWNAALQERIDAWLKSRKSISYEDQCTSLTQIRNELKEDWAGMNCSSQQITLRRLDKAFKAFFARCAKGQTPGFPRFKSIKRMPGFGFKSHGDGWRFTPNVANGGCPDDFGVIKWSKHGTLRIAGVGHIKARGQARCAGVIKSCELLHRQGEWSVSVTLACADDDVARQRTASVAMGADWGVSRLLTIAETNGPRDFTRVDFENPRWFKSSETKSLALARAISSKKRGSQNWKDACKANAKFKAKIARRRHDYQHKLTAEIAKRCAIFATEKLNIKNMSCSATGTVEEPGKNVAQKRGLNREIMDTAGAALFQKIAYKVMETGGQFLEAPTARIKPSQTCPHCGSQVKKTLDERTHHCDACGHEEDRDAASALVVLKWALGTLPAPHKPKVKTLAGGNASDSA